MSTLLVRFRQIHFRMKKGRFLLLSSIVLLVISLLPLHRALPAPLTLKGNLDLFVPANFADGPVHVLPLLSTLVLDIKIESTSPVVDNLVIEDSQGGIAFGPEKIYNNYHLEWVPMKLFDTYRFIVNNPDEASNQSVAYTLRIYPYSTILFIIGMLLLILGALQIVREEHLTSRLKISLSKRLRNLIQEPKGL